MLVLLAGATWAGSVASDLVLGSHRALAHRRIGGIRLHDLRPLRFLGLHHLDVIHVPQGIVLHAIDELGKQVSFEMNGGDVQMDRAILDALLDPAPAPLPAAPEAAPGGVLERVLERVHGVHGRDFSRLGSK